MIEIPYPFQNAVHALVAASQRCEVVTHMGAGYVRCMIRKTVRRLHDLDLGLEILAEAEDVYWIEVYVLAPMTKAFLLRTWPGCDPGRLLGFDIEAA